MSVPRRLISGEVLRAMAQENARWPSNLVEVPPELWPPTGAIKQPPERVFRSRDFLVQEYHAQGEPIRLSIQSTMLRTDGHWMDEIPWDDLQRLKRQVGYGNRFAIECYPEDEHVVNDANLRHLWILRERPEWAWRLDA